MRNRGEGGLEKIGRIWYFTFYNLKGEQKRRSSKSEVKGVAIEMLRKAKEELAKGHDPQAAKKVKYEDMRAALVKDYAEKGQQLPLALAHCDAYFGGMNAININRSVLEAFKDSRTEAGAANATINRSMSLIRRMFNLMIEQECLSVAPKFPMLPEGHVDEESGRFVSNVRQGFVEPDAFDKILTKLPERLWPIVMFLYEVGCRVGAASKLTWKYISFTKQGAVFTVPGEVTKNGEPLTYVLSDALTAILRKQFRTVDGPVFDSANLRNCWTKAVELVFMDGLLLHDLRRSAVRNMIRAGIDRTVARKISGHKTEHIFTRYDITDNADLIDAKKKLADYLADYRDEAKEAAGD